METRRPIYQIANEIIEVWFANRGKKYANKGPNEWRDVVYFGAVPYLEALRTMRGDEGYLYDTTTSVVLYALSNMSAFRGTRAKALKAELKEWAK